MKQIIIYGLFFTLLFSTLKGQQSTFYRTYGEGVYNSGQAVIQASDSGYYVCGGINEFNNDGLNMLLFKTDSLGVQQWRKSIGGAGIDFAKHFTYSIGGNGFILVGYTNRNGNYDGLIVSTNINGDTLWTKVYGGSDWDMLYSIDTTYDGNYIIAGETFSFGSGNNEAWVLKINQFGDTLWTKTYGGAGEDNARWVFEDRDSNYVVVGSTDSYGNGLSDIYMIYLDENGDSIWTHTEGTSGNEYGYSGDMFFDASNNMSFMIGGTIDFNTHVTFFNPRISTTGSTIYIRQGAMSYIFDRDKTRLKNEGGIGRFYISYQTKMELSTQWEAEFQRTFYGAAFGYVVTVVGDPFFSEYAIDITKTYDKAYVLTGEVHGPGPNIVSAFLTKIDSSGISPNVPVLSNDEIEIENGNIVAYPNPTSDYLFVSGFNGTSDALIKLIDMNGNEVWKNTYQLPSGTIFIDVKTLSQGNYIVQIHLDSGTRNIQIIKN